MLVRTIVVGPLQCNCTILGCEETGEALVIDPGDEIERILEALRTENLACTGIFHTHAHIDHLGATAPLKEATGASILLHAEDQPLYEHVPDQAALFGFPTPPTAPIDRYIQDGEVLGWGRIRGEVLHTPGHTPGGISLRIAPQSNRAGGADEPDRLFSGDTLFAGSVGRTDLWGGNWDQLLRSIRERLLTLPDETIVVPGHGPPTTIGEERRRNPFLIG